MFAEIGFLLGMGLLLRKSSRELAPLPPTFTSSPASDASGRELALALPNTIPERDAAILDLLSKGFVPEPAWTIVTYTKDGHEIQFAAANDALMLGAADPIRFTVRHTTAQRIADLFGAMLPTSRLADMAYANAIQLAPQPGPSDEHMSDTSRMIEHSDRVTKAIAGRSGLFRDVGKDWANTERLLLPDGSISGNFRNGKMVPNAIAAANFGWHSSLGASHSPGGAAVIQPVGLAHDIGHTDYSQVTTLYGKTVSIDGAPMAFEDVMRDPTLAYLVCDEVQKGTPARVWRHPAVPELAAV